MTALLLSVVLFAAAGDKELKLFQLGGRPAAPAPASEFDKLRAGMTLREIVHILGPGYVPEFSGTGIITWTCADGRVLSVMHCTNPNAVPAPDGKDNEDSPRLMLRDKNGKDVPPPPKGYTDDEAAKFAEALKALDKEFEDDKKKRPTTIEGYFELLKIDAKKLPKPSVDIGNATDFHRYKLSPKWELVASYNQFGPKDNTLRAVDIRGPAKP